MSVVRSPVRAAIPSVTYDPAQGKWDAVPDPVGLPASFSSLVGFGDSMTAGSNASTAANRWLNIFATAMSAGTPLNNGISATVLQNSNGAAGTPLTNNGRDRYVADLLGTNKRRAVAIAYGYNDGRYTGSGTPGDINSTNFAVDLREILIGLIQGGYDPSQIIVMTPAYITDTGLESGSADFSGQTRSNFLEYITEATTVAAEFGVYFFDQYAHMLANGAGTLIDTDNIHPTDAGHAVMADGVAMAKRQPYRQVTNVQASATSSTELTVTWGAVSGATGYDVEIFTRGAVTATASSTSATTSKVFTGLSAGEYVARVRVSGYPWGWQVVPVAVGSTIPLLDNFNGSAGLVTSHTSDSGHTWTSQPGQTAPSAHARVANGRVHSNSVADRAAYQSSVTPANADYSVTAYIASLTNAASDQVGVCGRMQAAADTYYFARYNNSAGTGTFSLFARSAGSNTQIGSNFSRTLQEGEIVKLTLTMSGTTITMLVDDVSRASGTNATISTAGKPGFYVAGVNNSDTAGAHIDNLYMVAS